MSEHDELKARIERAREAGKPPEKTTEHNRQAAGVAAALGHAMGMVVAVAIGAFIGSFIDNALGTGPFGLLIFLVFGMAAGFLNIIRAAKEMAAKAEAAEAARTAREPEQD